MTTIRLSTHDYGQRLDEDKKRLIRTVSGLVAGASVAAMVGGPFFPEKKFVPWIVGAGQIAGGAWLFCASATLKRERGFEEAEQILVRKNFTHEVATSHYVQKQLQVQAAQAVIEGRVGPAVALSPAPTTVRDEVRYSGPVSSQPTNTQEPMDFSDYQGYVATEEEPDLFDWSLFNSQPEKFPHIFIVGGTGDGKSFTAECLATLLEGTTIVSAPHKKPSDFVNLPSFCGGRNYGNWKTDKPIDFKSLLTGEKANGEPLEEISCATFLKTLYAEMDARFKMRDMGNEDYPMVNAILDESNTMIASLLRTGRDQFSKKVIDDFTSLVREARKVKIRLFCLVQSTLVKPLGLDGQSDIRNCFRFVTLGEFAHEEAKNEANNIVEWVRRQERPMLVEGMPARLPAQLVVDVERSISQKLTRGPIAVVEAEVVTPSLDPLEWPAINYPDDLRLLPPYRPGVYAVYAGNRLLYIGESTNLWERWNSWKHPHHIKPELNQCSDVQIRFYTTDDLSDKERKDLETRLHIELAPPWNGQKREVPAAEEPKTTVEDLLALVLKFVREKGEATVREVMKSSDGQKHNLSAEAIKGMFQELEERGEGVRTETEFPGGKTQVKFTANKEEK